jgi:hypothetical protein
MKLSQEGFKFFMALAKHPAVPQKVIENPVGVVSTAWRIPDQIIQPYMFGDDASKKTCLWMIGEGKTPAPKLLDIPPKSQWFPPRMVEQPNGKDLPRWSNQTDSGQNRLPPSARRAEIRSETYPGIARAFVQAWG